MRVVCGWGAVTPLSAGVRHEQADVVSARPAATTAMVAARRTSALSQPGRGNRRHGRSTMRSPWAAGCAYGRGGRTVTGPPRTGSPGERAVTLRRQRLTRATPRSTLKSRPERDLWEPRRASPTRPTPYGRTPRLVTERRTNAFARRRVLPPRVHLENGIEEAKSECGRILSFFRDAQLSIALERTTNVRPRASWPSGYSSRWPTLQ